jgi:hypothetical protein
MLQRVLKSEETGVTKTHVPRIDKGRKDGYFMFPDKLNEKGEMIVTYGDQVYVATTESRTSHLVVDQDKVKVESYEARRVSDDAPKK